MTSFWDFDWGATLQRDSQDSFPDETILATAYESAATMKGPKPGWDKDMHFVMSGDFFRSAHRKLVSCGNQFELIGSQAGAPPLVSVHSSMPLSPCCYAKLLQHRLGHLPQSSGKCDVPQVFVALPSDCPTHPDGSSRSVQPGASSSSVVLYASSNEGKDFTQVRPLPACADKAIGNAGFESSWHVQYCVICSLAGVPASARFGPGLQPGQNARWRERVPGC